MKTGHKKEWLITAALFLLIVGSVSAATSFTATVTCVMPDLIGTSNEAIKANEKTVQNVIAVTQKEINPSQQEIVTTQTQDNEVIMTVCAK